MAYKAKYDADSDISIKTHSTIVIRTGSHWSRIGVSSSLVRYVRRFLGPYVCSSL